MEASRKPLAKVEGRKRMRVSGLTVAWRGTPSLDDWVAYIVTGTKSKKLILAAHTSERTVKGILARILGRAASYPHRWITLCVTPWSPTTRVV